MESLHFPQFDPQISQVSIALFTKVSNAGALKLRIIAAATAEGQAGDVEREAVNFAFIDARLITSKLHLETAVCQALLAASQDALRTRTVHSEVLYNLNPTHNITEAIRRYGVSDANTDVIVVRIDSPELTPEAVLKKMEAVVVGTLSPFSDLENITDWASIKKYHKLNGELAITEAAKDPQKEHAVIDKIVTSSVAMKSVMS
ncbi:CGI-121-domain-containing protein [Pholiota conissans]|uniref:EKC/KEOPS complex subunit CGI121 n=1 Tax=Pholiota conissans TaxID=109636 RepID=A0A9P6CXS0_9AGAR|nr:CGI-121-domain-containing protein [Pholiota conissans]